MTDAAGITPDVARVMEAAAIAHQETGVPITTHSTPRRAMGFSSKNSWRSAASYRSESSSATRATAKTWTT